MAKFIEISEIERAQKIWAERIVEIGKAFLQNGDYKLVAKNLVDDLYGYREGNVLFKPTKASEQQFRLNAESALSYFVGDNLNFPEDKGFALQPWEKIRFENAGVICKENHALAMGNYYFTDTSGNEVKVEYTFGYFVNENGDIKINLHHSSLPYSIT
ncbi:MAG: hypothetical protein ACP5D9_15485 [Mariniphaga sp.]